MQDTQPPTVILNDLTITFEKESDCFYAAFVPAFLDDFPGLNTQYKLRCYSRFGEEFSERHSWLIVGLGGEWVIPSSDFGANPAESLRRLLRVAEDVSQGRAGTTGQVSSSKKVAYTNTNFDFSKPTKYWTGESIAPHFFGANVAALKGRRYKKWENSTNIKSMAMLDDLEDSLGIGRHCAIEVLSEGNLARGTLWFVQESYSGFTIHFHLYYADGMTISNRLGMFVLGRNFKISKRHLNGQWLEVLPK
jgi:hypothetical protein